MVREVDAQQKREFRRVLGWSALMVIMLMIALAPSFKAGPPAMTCRNFARSSRRRKTYDRQATGSSSRTAAAPSARAARAASWPDRANRADTLVIEACSGSSSAEPAIVAAAR